jgi:hypothetical protein
VQDGNCMVAHAGIRPVWFEPPGGTAGSMHIIDWADAAGAGVLLYREVMRQTATLFGVGGSGIARKVVRKLGFSEPGLLETHVAAIRPWRQFRSASRYDSRLGNRMLILAVFGVAAAFAQPLPADRLLDAVATSAELFRQQARALVSEETLVQRCYRIPEHPHLAIGKAAEPLRARVVATELVSQYTLGSLKNDRSGNLLEIREIVEKNGAPVQTPAAARKALSADISLGEEKIRKKMLAGFTDLGLLDVATDYGPILLAFTRAGQRELKIEPVGPRLFGTDDAFVFHWTQSAGGLLDIRGRKTSRLAMQGELWVRPADGAPLRVTASVEHNDGARVLREDATIEFVLSHDGCPTPITVAHRHYVDAALLTENLYTYAPFRRFGVDTTIRYGADTAK